MVAQFLRSTTVVLASNESPATICCSTHWLSSMPRSIASMRPHLGHLKEQGHFGATTHSATRADHREPRSTIVTSVCTKSSPLKRSGSPIEIASAYEKQSP
jgi:hypothetical protein